MSGDQITNVGELKKAILDLPDDMPIIGCSSEGDLGNVSFSTDVIPRNSVECETEDETLIPCVLLRVE